MVFLYSRTAEAMHAAKPVIFGPDGDYMLEASAMEVFNLAVDPVEDRLLPAGWLSLGWVHGVTMVRSWRERLDFNLCLSIGVSDKTQ